MLQFTVKQHFINPKSAENIIKNSSDMSKKGMKLTGILQNHNQHPESDLKYEPLRTNIRHSKQKPIQNELTRVSHVSRKLQSLSPQQADLIKNTVHIPVNCGLRVTSNEDKQNQALQRRYVAIDMYEKEGSKPISPNTFERLPKNQKYEVVYEYHCPHSEGKVEEYYNSDHMTQSKRVTTVERQNYQLNDNGAAKNVISSTSQQSNQQTIIRNTISPSSSNQVIRNNVLPSGQVSGQTSQTKVVTHKIYGPQEGKPIDGAVAAVNNTGKNNKFAGSTIKSESVIDYEVKSRIKSPESNIKGEKSGVKGSIFSVKEANSVVKNQEKGNQQNRTSYETQRRNQVISDSKSKDTAKNKTIYGPRQGQPIGGGSQVSLQYSRHLEGSTIKDRNSIYEQNTQGATQSIQRTTLYQEQYRQSTQNRGSFDRTSSQQRISMSPIKVTTQTHEIHITQRDSAEKNNVDRNSKDSHKRQSVHNEVVSAGSNGKNTVNRVQQNRNSSVSKQNIYGPTEGRPIGDVTYRQSTLSHHEGQESSLISSKVIVYDQKTSSKANQQGIRTNTSPSTKVVQQTVVTTTQTQRQTVRPTVNQIQEGANGQFSQRIVEYQAEYIGQGGTIAMQPLKVTTKTEIKQTKTNKNGEQVTVVRETTSNGQSINNNGINSINTAGRATSPTIQRNSISQDIHGSNASRHIIYGPVSGQPINDIHHHASVQGIDSTIVSQSRHVSNYGPSNQSGPLINQVIRNNTSPSTKFIREGTSPNRGQYQQQQTSIYTREEYRANGGSSQLIANDDNGYLSGPAYFETQGRMKYNQIGQNGGQTGQNGIRIGQNGQTGINSRNQNNEISSKKQISSGGIGGTAGIGGTTAIGGTTGIEIGGRSKANTRQTFDDFESNIGINSRHNQTQKNMNSTREYSRRQFSKEDVIEGQETQVKGEYRIERDGGDLEESRERGYVQNVESRIIIGGNGQGRSQHDLGIKSKKKVQMTKEQAEYQLKAQKQRGQYTRNEQQVQQQFIDSHNPQPFPLHISTRPAMNSSTNTSPQLQQRRKKLSQYQQTGTKGYNFKKGAEQTESKRKKQEYKYNLYSMLDEQFNMKCATGLCVPNEICASSPKRDGWK